MSVVELNVYRAFRAVGVPEEKAVKAVQALLRRDGETGSLKAELQIIKLMMYLIFAFQLGTIVKLFSLY